MSPRLPTDPPEALLGDGAAEAGTGEPAGEADPAKVRVRCDGCGPRVIRLDDVRLLDRSSGAVYVFTCDGCGRRVRRPADAALRGALLGAGVSGLTLLGGGGTAGAGERD
ncbi:MAG TPA: hypothetical protein VGM10_33185 [Actinocrinis sp.]